MKINDYQQKALRTMNWDLNLHDKIVDCALGLAGEAGEVADDVKKWFAQGHELNFKHMAEELGDVAWYIAVMAHVCGYDLESVLKMNIEKLKKRYPNGFSSDMSVKRNG